MAGKHREREVRRGDGYVTVRGNKDGTFSAQARWPEDGKWPAESFRRETKEEAVNAAEDHLRSRGRLRRSGQYTPESRITVNDAILSYLERGKRRWKPTTYSLYSWLNDAYIHPYLGNVRMVKLTPLRVQHWIDTLTRRKGRQSDSISSSMLENLRVVLNGACKECIRLGVITHNPVTHASLPARVRPRYMVWSADEVGAVLQACSDETRMHTYYVVALTTAMRPGEIRALKWADIDFENGRLTVQRTITKDSRGRQVLGSTTKTGRFRTIALSDETLSAFRSQRADQNTRRLRSHRWEDLDLVFDRGDGHILPQNTVVRAHHRICADANVRIIRMHDLRHTAATLLVEAGTHIKVVSDILGHSSVSITMDTYSHPGESIQRGATDYLGGIVSGKRRDA